MITVKTRILGFLFISALLSQSLFAQNSGWNVQDQQLSQHWFIQSAAQVKEDGSVISTTQFQPQDWYPTTVPHTVLATLVDDSVYKNIFFAQNLDKISDTPFNQPWWYRTTFQLGADQAGSQIRLRFNGINYRAEIWLNGHLVAGSDSIAGSFRRFTLDITPYTRSGTNVLAVQVIRPRGGELAIGFVDWNPEPADHDMGIWRDVQLLESGPVSIDEPFVKTMVDSATLDHADVTLSAELQNHTDKPVSGLFTAIVGDHIQVSQQVSLEAGESKIVSFDPAGFPALGMDHPNLWWTYEMGKPNLYHLEMKFTVQNELSDKKELSFGIRTITGYMTAGGFRGYRLNGKDILIKGGGWTDPMLLNATPQYEEAGIDYAVQMHLNAIRMEGFWGHDQHIFDLCDQKGILVMAGFSCQWEWPDNMGGWADKYGGIKTPVQMHTAACSFNDQITWLRNHPSIFLWLYGSDKWPRPDLETQFLDILSQEDPTRPYAQSAAEHTSAITGPSGMKMRGPYDYVPPDYWYVDTKNGGAFGFNTETSPGPEVPVLESLEKMIPKDSLWPIGSAWMFHAARGEFHNLSHYDMAMDNRLGQPRNLKDYLRKAQYLNYEGMRAMYEAFEANRFNATGIIQWMYNASWPKLWWQLYDYYLVPTAAFYGARKACEPVHIAYNYATKSVELDNNTLEDFRNLKAKFVLMDTDLTPLQSAEIPVSDLKPQQTLSLSYLPDSALSTPTYYLELNLSDDQGKMVSHNFYVLSTKMDVLDSTKTTWYITPESKYADLNALQDLPMVKLDISKQIEQKGDSTFTRVTLKNPSKHLAFMVCVDLLRQNDQQIVAPIFWEDNYITLLPGEKRTITGYAFTSNLDGQAPEIRVSGWNVE